MRLSIAIVLAGLTLALGGGAAEGPAGDPALVAANTYPFAIEGAMLTGPGARFLELATAKAQFVLIGEDHHDSQIPLFARGLYALLDEKHGFDHLAVEQDGLAIEEALRPGVRGHADRIGGVAGRYPSLFEFPADPDLELLADVGRRERGKDPIWGVEQATSAVRYLEELATLAPTPQLKAEAARLLAKARSMDSEPVYSLHFLHDEPSTTHDLYALQAAWRPKAGSRAARLLTALATSSEIYGYDRRANDGEPVGLFNNTEREAWMKARFMEHYRGAPQGPCQPKALLKFGDNHMVHGRNRSAAYPIGNMVQELAVANGCEAIGIEMVITRPDYGYDKIPAWLRPLLPATTPSGPVVIDLRPLRAIGGRFRKGLAPEDAQRQRDVMFGFELIVLLPDTRPATTALSGLRLP